MEIQMSSSCLARSSVHGNLLYLYGRTATTCSNSHHGRLLGLPGSGVSTIEHETLTIPSAGSPPWLSERKPASGAHIEHMDGGASGHGPPRPLMGRFHGTARQPPTRARPPTPGVQHQLAPVPAQPLGHTPLANTSAAQHHAGPIRSGPGLPWAVPVPVIVVWPRRGGSDLAALRPDPSSHTVQHTPDSTCGGASARRGLPHKLHRTNRSKRVARQPSHTQQPSNARRIPDRQQRLQPT